jgi:hypothetical protein
VSSDEVSEATDRGADLQRDVSVVGQVRQQRDDGATGATEPPTGAAIKRAATDGVPLIDGDAEIQRAEAQLQPRDMVPADSYQAYLRDGQAGPIGAMTGMPADTALLNERIKELEREAGTLVGQADQQAYQAQATATAAAKARRRERERLEVLAVREQRSADSLRAEALLRTAEVERLKGERAAAGQQQEWRQRVMKFYYLTPDDQRIVFSNTDESRYFQLRALALEQADAAADADRAAKSNRDVAQLMRTSALDARLRAGGEPEPDPATLDEVSRLEARAGLLLLRADSLDRVAGELRAASAVNMQQAGVLLQAMESRRSNELQELESRSRTDAALAGIRQPTASDVALPPPTPAAADARATDVQQPVAVTVDRTVDAAPPTAAMERAAAATGGDGAPGPVMDPMLQPERLPEELVSDLFVMQPAGMVRTVAIPLDAPMPGGIIFKVQIGAFRKPVAVETFSDIDPVMGETLGNGLVRYTAGLFRGFKQASEAKDKVRGRGYTDAFVVAYRDGKRITLGEAMRAAVPPPVPPATEAGAITVATASTNATTDTAAVRPAGGSVPPPPPPPPVAPPVIDDAAILARYPATTEQVLQGFAPPVDATAYYDVPGAAPATQVETVRGLFYTVQVGVYSRPVPLDKLFNITPLNSERTETAKVRYTTGIYTDMDSARTRRDEAVALGVKDAFITAYLNGRRIPMREAALLLLKYGPGILATP